MDYSRNLPGLGTTDPMRKLLHPLGLFSGYFFYSGGTGSKTTCHIVSNGPFNPSTSTSTSTSTSISNPTPSLQRAIIRNILKMYAGWSLVLTLIIAFFCSQSTGFWPFTVKAETEAQDIVYPDATAKRIAIIGMYIPNIFCPKLQSILKATLPGGFLRSYSGLLSETF